MRRSSPGILVSFRWERRPGGRNAEALRRVASDALRRLGVDSGELGVLICGDATIRSLNRRFRRKNKATDVLSFPAGFAQPDGPPYLGDIAISLDTAVAQAAAAGHAVLRELELLLLHGVLHVCGLDHEADNGEMSREEARLRLELLGE
ncbi:MAG: rRNA maturation RNase YbeY [Acidobacteriota bacterium]